MMNDSINNPTGSTTPTERAGAHADDAREAAQDVQAKAEEKLRQTKEQAFEAADQVKAKAAGAARDARERGERMLEEQKARVASEVAVYADAARRAAEKLSDESDSNLAGYVSSAADYLDRFGRRIDERGVTELVDDVRLLARRRPEIFYGGMFVAGLAAARFLKSSADRRTTDEVRSFNTSFEEPERTEPVMPPESASGFSREPSAVDPEVVVTPASVSDPISDLSKEGY